MATTSSDLSRHYAGLAPGERLATVSMAVTVGLVTLVGVHLLGLPVGVAVLLGAILAPTDPVLASDVQVAHPWDQVRLRFALTGEAGMNDGAAFPFVMLGLMGLHQLGPLGWRWVTVDVVWAVVGGLAIDGAAGAVVGRLVIYLRRTHREAVGLDDFLPLGLPALPYGAALAASTYGFLAAFAAGLALRRVESASEASAAAADAPSDVVAAAAKLTADPDHATYPEKAPAYNAGVVIGFNEQLERNFEVAVVLLLGGMLTAASLPGQAVWFVPLLLLLVVRPLSGAVGLVGAGVPRPRQGLIGWFGIRGVGSVYYPMYAVTHGLVDEHARLLAGLVLTTAAASVVAHGVSVTPVMKVYGRRTKRARGGSRATVAGQE